MALASVDSLQDLTSEISSEVEEQEQQQQEAAPPWVALDPEKQPDEVVIMYAVMAAKSFAQVFVEGGKWLVELKSRFGVRQGTRGKQLKIEGNLIYWDQFCGEYLHVTADYFKQLVAGEKNPPVKKPDEDKPLYKKGYVAGQEKLKTELLAKGVDIEEVVPAPENPKPFTHPSGTPTAEDLWSLSDLNQYAANWADYCEAASELLTKHARSIGLYKKFEVIAPAPEDGVVDVDLVL